MENFDQTPPKEEPAGYEARAGFVKAHSENNEFYLEQYRDHRWYPVLKRTHESLEKLIPGYNISQIKEKFGDLCYYIEYPDPVPVRPETTWLDTEEKVRASAEGHIRYAEAWAAGWDARDSLG